MQDSAATLRPEGFVSLYTDAREGIMGTHAFVSDGERLIVNAVCAPGGFLDVELAAADDQVVPGYERASCDTFSGDATNRLVTWKGRAELPTETLKRGAKLRFFSRYCHLYSIRVT